MPTAFPMERGELHVANQELVAISSSYGITDRFSALAGVSVPGALLSLRGSAAALPRVGVCLGGLAVVPWIETDVTTLLPYALVSVGEEMENITVGAGIAFFPKLESGPEFAAVQVAGGKISLSPRTALVSETWIVQTHRPAGWSFFVVAPSLAVRILSERASWDLGFFVPVAEEMEGVQPIPWVAVSFAVR